MLASLVERQVAKDWYTTAEVAKLLDRAEYTVREWCRQGRMPARNRADVARAGNGWCRMRR